MIYFLQEGEDGPIKIGFSHSKVKSRYYAIRSGNTRSVRFLGTMPGDMKGEKALHERFAAHRLAVEGSRSREWFHPAAEILDYVREFAEPLDPAPARSRERVPRRKAPARLVSTWTVLTLVKESTKKAIEDSAVFNYRPLDEEVAWILDDYFKLVGFLPDETLDKARKEVDRGGEVAQEG